ncbi:two-component regulator propeller domain-containing protein [Bacteroides nordii]|uniref:hybrid sensor histidine kinase/response regulator transcription factor n=1 Tax=Bacteroides nordii TaxID=291645 RepID=UPI002A7FBF48|nr:two-component regulator propeller domain-containing protein [Bacteroides nordii]
MNTPRLLLYLIACLLAFPLYSFQSKHLNFVHIGLKEGLSHNTVFDIVQDRDGYIWVATKNGLNRYNGYNFTTYHHDEEDSCSIGSDYIRACTIDLKGNVWLGTAAGLSLYDAERECFENFVCMTGEKLLSINGIVPLNEKRLLVYEIRKTMLLFDIESRSFLSDSFPAALATLAPQDILLHGDNLCIGTDRGVFLYSLSQRTLKKLLSCEKGHKLFVRDILLQDSNLLWVATEGDGLFRINLQTEEITHYIHRAEKKYSISSDQLRSLALDPQNRLWVGAINGLNIYNEQEDDFHIYHHNPEEKGSLSHSSIRSIFMDTQGGMWLGTYYGGLNYYHPYKERFLTFEYNFVDNSLSDNVIESILEDKKGGLWIGTNSGGLNHYDFRTQQFTVYTMEEGLGANNVRTIAEDEKSGRVYIGTHMGGLCVLDRRTGHIEQYKDMKSVHCITPTTNGEYWLSSMDAVMCFNSRTHTFTRIDSLENGQPMQDKAITAIVYDSKLRLWFLSENGINVYTEKDGVLSPCSVLPEMAPFADKITTCLHESQQQPGVFWIGTHHGIYYFNEKTGSVKQYTTRQGLPNNVVHGILEDETGRLWLSTDQGVSCFQPSTEQFRNYTVDDGLQSNLFNRGCCRTADGRMYFGGINGITTFKPETLMDNPYTPPVNITTLKLFNKTVKPGDESGLLKKSIAQTGHITLEHSQSMISIGFGVLNYMSGNRNTFAYMLEGYDREWYYTCNREVSYTNLPHGTYCFKVKAANNDGKWNDNPTELKITVLPVWYKTWWALGIFVIIFFLIVFATFRYYWIRKSMKIQLNMERMDKERLAEVNEMKLRFFANISHELRTPLTMILAPLEDLFTLVDDYKMYKLLRYIQNNANRLLYLVNQLLDYRRADSGVLKLRVKPVCVHDVIKNNFLLYDLIAQRKKLSYYFHSDMGEKHVWCDPYYLELIVNNLLSNAFKNIGKGKSISVLLKEEDHTLVLQVVDTGNGISADQQAKIFEYFYQTNYKNMGSGIGLSLVKHLVELHHGRIELESKEGVGSTFSVYLPTEESAYQPDEKVFEQEENQPEVSINQKLYAIEEKEEYSEIEETEGEEEQEKILIVEDFPDVRRYLSEELGKSYQLVEASNGKEALELMQEHEFGLILTDVNMPVMDGLQFCKQVKQSLYTCHIPIIILSAKIDLQEQLEGLQVGADDYIPKPFSLSLIKAKIKNLFRTRHYIIEHYTQSLEVDPKKIALNQLDEELLKKALVIVEKNLDNTDFSTEDFAREMLMSRSNLHLKIKALTGGSTSDFIHKVRFNKACKLMKEKQYSIAEISMMVGFSTPSYFTTSFKRFFGYSPSEYINSL